MLASQESQDDSRRLHFACGGRLIGVSADALDLIAVLATAEPIELHDLPLVNRSRSQTLATVRALVEAGVVAVDEEQAK